MVFSGLLVVLDATPSCLQLGLLDPANPAFIRGYMLPLYLDLLSLIVFSGAIATGLLFRANRVLPGTEWGLQFFLNHLSGRSGVPPV